MAAQSWGGDALVPLLPPSVWPLNAPGSVTAGGRHDLGCPRWASTLWGQMNRPRPDKVSGSDKAPD